MLTVKRFRERGIDTRFFGCSATLSVCRTKFGCVSANAVRTIHLNGTPARACLTPVSAVGRNDGHDD